MVWFRSIELPRMFAQTAKIMAAVCVTVLAGCSESLDTMPVSLVQLLAIPERYYGENVNTQGFLIYNPSGVGHLYLSKADAKFSTGNSILVVFDDIDEAYRPIEDFQARFVIVEGRFSRAYPSGKIVQLKRIIALEPRTLDDCRFYHTPGIDEPYPCGPRVIDRGREKSK